MFLLLKIRAGDVVIEIKESMHRVEEVYKQCEELSDIISPLKEVNRRFQQVHKMCDVIWCHNLSYVLQMFI